jgi:hypothetical protein
MKWLLVGFFLFALSRAVLRFRDGNINVRELVLLGLLWAGASVIVIWPEITGNLAQLLGVGRMTDAVVYLTVAALCYFIFRIYIRIRTLEQHLTALVRKLALRDAGQASAREKTAEPK